MKKSLLPLLLIAGLASGCATTSTLSTKDNVSVAKVKLDSVNVNLNQKYDNPVFYSQGDIEHYLSKCLVTELSKEGKYQANAKASVNINIDYKRVYTGEAFGMQKSISRPRIAYNYKILQDRKVLQQKEEKDLSINAGLLENLKTVATMDVGNTEKEAENSYLDALCRHIAEQVY